MIEMNVEIIAQPCSPAHAINIWAAPSASSAIKGIDASAVATGRSPAVTPGSENARQPSGICAARTYCSDAQRTIRLSCPPDCYLVTLVLANAAMALANGRHRLLDGLVPPGTACVTGPGQSLLISPRGGCSLLHLAVPVELVDLPRSALRKFGSMVVRDPLLGTIGALLTEAPASWLHANADVLSQIALVRLLHLAPRHSPGCLTLWRLKRVHAFVDGHIDEPLRLADLAAAAGLSRMHFAAQFRAATGMRPHTFVVSRRIDRAKTLMATTDSTLVTVALEAGFQSQAHFCAIFKQQTGMTPSRWRRRHQPGWNHAPTVSSLQ